MSLPSSQEGLGLFDRFSFHALLLQTGHGHGGMEGFQSGFF